MIWLLLPLLIAADAGAADSRADQVDLSDRVAVLVAQLGHDEYERREAAQHALDDLPAQALPLLSRAYRDSTDAEVRMRLRLYADRYFQRHVLGRLDQFKRPGYLGIMQQDGRLEDGRGFVQVVRVMPGTGADKAGIQPGDRIVAMNGNPMPAANATLAVAQYVQAHHAGDQLRCTILRDDKKLEITATLGGLPDEHLDPQKQAELTDLRQQLRDQWWARGFLRGDPHFQPEPGLAETGDQ